MRSRFWFIGLPMIAASLGLLTDQLTGAGAKQGDDPKPSVKLPLTQVVMFNSGVGYYARSGEIDGHARVDLTFPETDINDLIKSMTLQDYSGGKISAVSYDSHEPVSRTLASYSINLNNQPSLADILHQARGEKIEVVMQPGNATQPGSLQGTIVGVEVHKVAAGQTTLDTNMLTVLTAEGMRCLKMSDIQRVRFTNPVLENELKRALDTLALSHDSQKKSVSMHFNGDGKRKVKVGYVIEAPIWKTSYRLVLDKDAKPYLQGWAVVENTTDEDWSGVKMALVSGRPISFQMDLYNPLFNTRPVVEPELFRSLRPVAYEGGYRRSGLGIGLTGAGGGDGVMAANRPLSGRSAPAVGWNPAAGGYTSDLNGKLMDSPAISEVRLQMIQELLAQRNIESYTKAEALALQWKTQQPQDQTASLIYELAKRNLRAELARTKRDEKEQFYFGALEEAERLGPIAFSDESGKMQLAGATSSATAGKLGDFFQYVLDQPVSLARQKSALLPIMGKDIEATRVSIYNSAVQAKHPLLGLRFKNTTGAHLAQGPVTVFEGSTYAGDSRFLDISPNDERLIAYAIDLGVEVIPQVGDGKTNITKVKATKGIVHITRKQHDEKTYKISNKTDSARTIILEHPNRTNQQFKLVNTPKATEETAALWRFETKVEAGKSTEFKVTEERDLSEEMTLTNSNEEQIRFFINLNEASPELKKKLAEALKLKDKWNVQTREILQVAADVKRITADQDRIRKNLRETPKEADVYQEYLKKLSTQEKELDLLTAKEKKMMADEFAARKVYEDYLSNLEG